MVNAFRPLLAANKFFLISVLLLIVACATEAPKNFSEFKEGEWQGKVLIREKNKSLIVNVVAKALDGEKLRLDVTSPMGTHLASLLMDGSDIEYMNVVDRTLYKSKTTKSNLQDIFRVPLMPEALFNIFFDHDLTAKNWSCVKDEKGFLKSCKEGKNGLQIEWTNRTGYKRTIEIKNSTASIQINLFDFSKKVSEPDKAFKLKVPSSFKVKNI